MEKLIMKLNDEVSSPEAKGCLLAIMLEYQSKIAMIEKEREYQVHYGECDCFGVSTGLQKALEILKGEDNE